MERSGAHRLWPDRPVEPTGALPRDLEALVLAERPGSLDEPAVRLAIVGDVGLSGHVREALDRGTDPLTEVAPVLAAADRTLANLETPVFPHGPPPAGTFFAAPSDAGERLAAAGVDLVHLANNHVCDFGPAGLAASLASVAEAGLRPLGAGPTAAAAREPVVETIHGLRVAWLGAGRTLEPQEPGGPRFWELDAEALVAATAAAAETADLVVVSLHAGYMYLDVPHPEHRRLALDLAAAGASVVAVHHAHVLQGIETVAGRDGGEALLCHNLGNLLFDWTEGEVVPDRMVEEQRQGVVVLVDVDRRGVRRAVALPTRVDDGWTVRWARGTQGDAVLGRLERTSGLLALPAGELARIFDRQRAERTAGLALSMIGKRLVRGDLLWAVKILPRVRPAHLAMLVRWIGRRLGLSR